MQEWRRARVVLLQRFRRSLHAARSARRRVRNRCGFADQVGDFGFDVLAAGLDAEQLNARYAPYREQLQVLPFGDRRPYALAWRFAEPDAPAKVDELLAHARAWAPDLIVHETADFAAPAVAAAIGVESANHSFGRVLSRACLD